MDLCGNGSCDLALDHLLESATDTTIFGCNPLEAIYTGNPTQYYYKGSTNYWVKMSSAYMQLVTMGMQVVTLSRSLKYGKESAVKTTGDDYGTSMEMFSEKIEERTREVIYSKFRENFFTAAKDYYDSDLNKLSCKELVVPMNDMLQENFGSEAYVIVQCQNAVYGTSKHAVTGGFMSGANPDTNRYNMWRINDKNANVAYIPKRKGAIKSDRTALRSFAGIREFLQKQQQTVMGYVTGYDFSTIMKNCEEYAEKMGECVYMICSTDINCKWIHCKDRALDERNLLWVTGDNCGNFLVYGWKEE
jgi:hypothetical protein